MERGRMGVILEPENPRSHREFHVNADTVGRVVVNTDVLLGSFTFIRAADAETQLSQCYVLSA